MDHPDHKKERLRRWGVSRGPDLILKFRVPVVILFAAVTAFLCVQLKNLRSTADPVEAMFPLGHPFLPALKAIKKMAPEPRMLIAILEVKKGDIYNRQTIRKIDSITKGLMQIRGVLPGEITSLTRGIDRYENTSEGLVMDSILGRRWPETKEDFEKLKRRVAVNPRGLGRYVAYDGTAAMMTASLVDEEEEASTSYAKMYHGDKTAPSLEAYRKRFKEALQADLLEGVEEIRFKERDPGYNLYFMGPQLIEAQMTALGRRHIPVAAAVMVLLMVAALAFRFRTARGVLLPLAAMALSLLWSLGMLGASGIRFNPMALTFPLILGLFSLAYGVLFLEGCERGYRMTGDRRRAVRAGCAETPIAASLLTAGLAAACMGAARVPIFENLAWLGFFWLVGTAAVSFFFLPVLVSFLPAPRDGKDAFGPSLPSGTVLSRLSSGKGRHLLWVLPALLLSIGGTCAARLEVGDNIPGFSYIRPGSDWNQCFRVLAEKFMGPYQFLIYGRAREEGGLLDPEAVNAVGDFRRYLDHRCGARDTIAFDMMVTAARNMLMDGNPKWSTVPVSGEQVKGMGELVVEQGGVGDFIDRTFTEATVSPFFPDAQTEHIDEYASRMQAYIDSHPAEKVEFRLGGGLLGMTKAINDGTRVAYWKTLAAAFALVFACGILVTGSLLRGLVITLPVAAAQGVVWMIMAATATRINMPVALVSAVAVGFCSVFGASRLHARERSGGKPDAGRTAGDSGLERAGGAVPFLGVLLFAATLPWSFVGLRFPAQMVLAAGTTVLAAALLSALLLPAPAGPYRAGSSPDASQKEHP